MRRDLMALGPLLAAAIWGGMYVVSKWGFARVPPLTLAFLRVALGAAVLLVVVRVSAPAREFSRRDWRRFAGLGFWVSATLAAQFVGTDLTDASQGSLLTVTTPVFTLGLGVALLGEPLSRRKVAGTALAAAGTLLAIAGRSGLDPTGSLAGAGLLLASSVCMAAFTVYGKPVVRRFSALEAATYATALSAPMLALLVPLEVALMGPAYPAIRPRPGVIGAVLYLGVASTAAAWYFWYKGLEYVDAGTVAVFFFAQPVVGGALAALLLGEPVGPAFVAGGVVIAAGVYLVSTARARA